MQTIQLIESNKNLKSMDLRALIDVQKLQDIQDEFTRDTGLGMITVDAMGQPVTNASGFSPLCQFLRRDPEFRKRCFACDANGGFQAALQSKPFMYQCHVGLVDFSVPIMAGSHHLGAIMAGQVLLKGGQKKLGRIIGSTAFDPPQRARVLEMLGDVPHVEIAPLEQAAARIIRMANEAVGGRRSPLHLGPFIRTQPSDVSLTPLPDRFGQDAASLTPGSQPTETERLLEPQLWMEHVMGQQIGFSLRLTGEYLDIVYPRWSQKHQPAILAPFEDLMIGVAAELGDATHKEISQRVVEQRNRRTTPLNRYAAQKYCESLVGVLHESASAAEPPSLNALLNHIDKDPTRFLNCESAAEYLCWSESHFSRQFKQHVGETFIQYVTKRRIDRAKFLLRNTDQPVLRIAASLKFQPVNYFSRVFKRYVGLTPSEYRSREGIER